jgi:pimeloyl-ACP methyl ester carboxylesterase
MTAVVLFVIVPCILVLAGLVVFSWSVARRVERALPPDGKFVMVGKDRIHYVEYGSGPAIVFVHGLSGQLRNFAYLDMQALARSHRVILMDRPGAGYSVRHADSPAGIFAQGQTVASFIDALGLDKPLLVGHSLGGAVALAVGLNHPQSIRRLALIAPLTHVETRPPAAFRALAIRSPLWRRLISHTLAVPLSIRNGPAVLEAVFGPDPVPKDFRVRGGGLLGLRASSFYAASTDLVALQEDLPEMESRYRTLRVPVDVLFGRQDKVLNWKRHGEALSQKLEGASLQLVDGGHMLPVTAPAMTTQWLLALARAAG